MHRALVERARDGDVEAFSQLVTASLPRLQGVARLILRDASRAEDAVQDALVSAWRDLRALRDPNAWDAWSRRLTVRACYKVAKKDRRRRSIELEAMQQPQSSHLDDASTVVAERDRLEQELGQLTIDQRAVIVLHYYLDLTLPQVAEILDIPVGTVNSRLHRGLATMRSSIQGDGTPPSGTIAERPA